MNFKLFLFYMYDCFVRIYVSTLRVPTEPEERIWCSGIGRTEGYELPCQCPELP